MAQTYCLLQFSEQYVDYVSLTCPAKERDLLSECKPDILGVLLIKPLDNREIPRAKGVAFVWRNRGANVLIGGMLARGYLGISASAQILAVFHRTELTNDYPPHFLKHFSSSSLD